jgi:hypothetical protein
MPVEKATEEWPMVWIVFRQEKLEELRVIKPGVDYYKHKP